MDGMSLLDVLRGVMLDPAEQAVYDADPGAYLEHYGYQDVDPADLSEAFGLVADTLPVEQARVAWTGESGPQAPLLGDDTSDFDDGGPDDAAPADALDEDALAVDEVDDLDATGEGGADTFLSFGHGEEDEAGGAADDGGDDDYGLFGTAAPGDDLTDGLDDVDLLGPGAPGGAGPDDGPGLFDAADELDGGVEDDLDDTDDLAEIDGFGPVDHGPDDLDIGSF